MRLFYAAALFALLLDQISKLLVRQNLSLGGRIEVWPGVFHFGHVHNYGAAWGIMSGQKWLLIIFTLVVTALMIFSAREVVARGKVATVGFGLMLGGAIGNLVDRLWQGYVTDFIDFDTSWEIIRTFPVFNIADSALTVGVVLLILSLLFSRDHADSSPVPASSSSATENSTEEPS